MSGQIDLHTHTTASDGTLSPEDLVRLALASGLTTIAITDHDTVAGVLPAQVAAGLLQGMLNHDLPYAGKWSALTVLAGVELSILHDHQNIHLLGHGIDPADGALVARLRALAMGREERARAIVELLAAVGAPISWQRVLELGRGAIGRPHIASALVEAGHARDSADAFSRLIGEGCPAYLPSGRMSIEEAVALVQAAGGQVALAHPLASHRRLDLPAVLPVLCAAGLSGIEVYHSEHGPEATAYLRSLASDLGLWWTGGSDFHGPSKPGVLLGGVAIPPEVLDQGPFPRALTRGGRTA